jgi:hypothetical protein
LRVDVPSIVARLLPVLRLHAWAGRTMGQRMTGAACLWQSMPACPGAQ